MNRRTNRLVSALAIVAAGYLAAGCAQAGSASGALASLSASRSVSASPATSPPQTTAPPTSAPATSQPAPSREPVSRSPRPTVTVTAPAVPAPAPASASPATASGSGSSLLWLWIVLGAAAIAGVAAWIAHAVSRRKATAAGWRSKVIDAYAKGSALYDAMAAAEAPGALAAQDAGVRWADIGRRADDLTQTLYTLRESAPDEDGRARAADVLASLQAVRSAMDAERAPGGTSVPQGARIHSLLLSFESSLSALHSPGEYLPR